MKLYFETSIKRPFQYIQSHFNQNLFAKLSEGIIPFQIERFDGCQLHNEIHIKIGPRPLQVRWISVITSEKTDTSGWSFIDEGKILPWPLIYWHHQHRVDRISETDSKIVDAIEYKCSPAFLGILIKPVMWMVFSARPKRYQLFFKE